MAERARRDDLQRRSLGLRLGTDDRAGRTGAACRPHGKSTQGIVLLHDTIPRPPTCFPTRSPENEDARLATRAYRSPAENRRRSRRRRRAGLPRPNARSNACGQSAAAKPDRRAPTGSSQPASLPLELLARAFSMKLAAAFLHVVRPEQRQKLQIDVMHVVAERFVQAHAHHALGGLHGKRRIAGDLARQLSGATIGSASGTTSLRCPFHALRAESDRGR